MPTLKAIKNVIDYTMNCSLKVVDKAIKMIPPDKLNWRPIEDAMTITDLALHIYHMAFTYTWGTEKGKVTTSDYESMLPPKEVSTPEDIIKYGTGVKEYMRKALASLSEKNLTNEVIYHCWNDLTLSGETSMLTVNEEVLHHRGQLVLYLRLLGIKPPFIYDFS